jgi:hypothetical protein
VPAPGAPPNVGDSQRSAAGRRSGAASSTEWRTGDVGNTSSTGARRARLVGRAGDDGLAGQPPPPWGRKRVLVEAPHGWMRPSGGASVEACERERECDEKVLCDVESGDVLRGRYGSVGVDAENDENEGDDDDMEGE